MVFPEVEGFLNNSVAMLRRARAFYEYAIDPSGTIVPEKPLVTFWELHIQVGFYYFLFKMFL